MWFRHDRQKSSVQLKLFSWKVRNINYNHIYLPCDYYENLEESTGDRIELDVIAICCEWTEYENIEEFQKDYGDDYEDVDAIEQQTTVLRLDSGGFVIQCFWVLARRNTVIENDNSVITPLQKTITENNKGK